TAAFPLAIGLFLLSLIPAVISDQHYVLVADDNGLTIKQRLRWRRFMPWNDIALFVQLGKPAGLNSVAGYLLCGVEHSVRFTLILKPSILMPYLSDEPRQRGTSQMDINKSYRFEGGFERYVADARRLLATITARGHAPLQIITRQPAFFTSVE